MPVVRVQVEVDGHLEKALKAFKRKTQREGVTRDIKKNRFYEKPSAVRRKKLLKALRRRNRRR